MFNIIFSGAKEALHLGKDFFWRRRKIAFLIYLGLCINIACWGVFFWLFRVEQSLVILHYNVFLGIDSMMNIELAKDIFQMYLAPIGGTFFFLFNICMAFILGFFSDFEGGESSPEGSSFARASAEKSRCGAPDPGILGIYMILSGNVVLQLAVLLHAIAIFFVNR
jgi:hypothetical protein